MWLLLYKLNSASRRITRKRATDWVVFDAFIIDRWRLYFIRVDVMRFNRFVQNGVMAREESGQLDRVLLRQHRAALDVGEEEGDSAGRQFSH